MRTNEKRTRAFAGLGLVLVTLIWGFAFVVVKNSLDLIPPIYMVALRFTIAVVPLGLVFWKRLKKMTREIFMEGLVLGVLLFLSYVFQTVGCLYTTAGKNAFLTTVYVVIVPFLHWLLNKKKPDVYCMAAAFLAILGIGLLSLQGNLTLQLGDLLTLICGACFALHMIYIDRYAKRHDPAVLTVLQLGAAGVLGWAFAPFMDGGFPAEALSADALAGLLYLALLSTMVGFFLQNLCQKYTSPNTASLILSTESVYGAVFSVIFLKEVFTPRMLVGCAVILLAILTAETKLSFLPGRQRGIQNQGEGA